MTGLLRRNVWVTAARLAGGVLVAACAFFVVRTLVHDWPTTRSAIAHARVGWLAAGAACAVLSMVGMAERWGAAIVAVGGSEGRRHRVVSAFFVGEIGKYLPGGLWSVLGRGEMARREGHARPLAYSSVALSLAACYLAASITALLLIVASLLFGHVDARWWPVAVVAAAGLVLVHPAVSDRLIGLLRRITHRPLSVAVPDWSASLRLSASYIPVWVGIAAAGTCVTLAIDPHAPVLRAALATVAAWVIGFATPSPGGIGVREAVFIATAGIPGGTAAAVAIVCRLLYVAIDSAGAGAGAMVLRGPGAASAAGGTEVPDGGAPEPVAQGSARL